MKSQGFELRWGPRKDRSGKRRGSTRVRQGRCQNRGSSGISLGDALRLPKRHPAWRRREAQSGSCMERENLAGDAKGKGASGSNREAESTDAPERGGLPCSSAEADVMLVERRGASQLATGGAPILDGRRQPSCDGTSRMTRECQGPLKSQGFELRWGPRKDRSGKL